VRGSAYEINGLVRAVSGSPASIISPVDVG
jgi:hypothetical protein